MSFNININPSEVLQERTVPREGCPGGRRAWRGPAGSRGHPEGERGYSRGSSSASSASSASGASGAGG